MSSSQHITRTKEISSKPVIQEDFNGKITRYPSITEAARQNKRTVTAISYACRGITKISAGSTWRYAK